jgi:hypothetical protein
MGLAGRIHLNDGKRNDSASQDQLYFPIKLGKPPEVFPSEVCELTKFSHFVLYECIAFFLLMIAVLGLFSLVLFPGTTKAYCLIMVITPENDSNEILTP